MADATPYSWRSDPTVPAFSDDGTIAVMDGACVLCMFGARLIDTFDRTGSVGICPAQTPLGAALLNHYGMAPDDPDTWLVLDRGTAYESLDAIIHLGRRIGGVGWLLQIFRLLPRTARHWLYQRIARNRYALFARRDTCTLPTPRLQNRLVEAAA
ncbi:MAG: DUF393 domain-containing protein [Pseudomonadota bacterium]